MRISMIYVVLIIIESGMFVVRNLNCIFRFTNSLNSVECNFKKI